MTEHKIKWSHSSLKDYEGCARRYHEVKVLNNYPFQETEQTRYGKELHKAAEDYVKDGTPIPKVSKLSSSFEHNTWNPTQSALCNWCPVRTCELHPKH
jgi:hypothetical protein